MNSVSYFVSDKLRVNYGVLDVHQLTSGVVRVCVAISRFSVLGY